MGHIINAKLYRLGYTTFWYNRLFSPRKAVYAQESALYFKLDSYFKSVFSYSSYFTKQGLVYAFLSLSKDNLGLCSITVYYHDPLLDRFFFKFLKRFFRQLVSVKGRPEKKRFSKDFKKKNSNPFITESNLPTFRSTVAQRCNGFFQSIICRRFSGDFPRFKCSLSLKRLNSGSMTPSLVGFYILSKLRSVFPIKSVLTKLIRYFHSNSRYAGVSIKVSGRFSRAEMASSRVETFGKVSLSTKSQLVDYGVASVPLKYGTTGVKIWLNLVY